MTQTEFEKLIKEDRYQVFVFTSLCAFPISFARHAWFVINKKGVTERWEIIRKRNLTPKSYGYLYMDFLPPTVGMAKSRASNTPHWQGNLVKVIEGDENSKVKEMVDFIENSKDTYPLTDVYHMFTGPNSNTYPQWVVDHFPEFNIKLPFNCYGKGFKQTK